MMNGTRQVALLRGLVPPASGSVNPITGMPEAVEDSKRTVFFAGDLTSKVIYESGAMTMEQIVNALSQVYTMSFNRRADRVIQCHKEAQLIILTGSSAEISLVQDALRALREKAKLTALRPMSEHHEKDASAESKSP